MSRIIDLSHTIENGLMTYKGLPAPVICDYWTRESSKKHYAPDTSFHIGKIELVGNTGTYVDVPFHRYEHGKDLSELPLTSLVNLQGLVVRATGIGRALGPELFQGLDLSGKAVLVQTDWADYWGSERYFDGHPFLTEAAAVWLRDHGTAFVGIDSLNIDNTGDPRRPVHSTLLGADIPVCEHLCNLERLPQGQEFRFHAAPVKIRSFGSFPVRAYAILP